MKKEKLKEKAKSFSWNSLFQILISHVIFFQKMHLAYSNIIHFNILNSYFTTSWW